MVAVSRKEYDPIALRLFEACAARTAAEPPRRYLGMSRIGEPCDRRLWLGLRSGEEIGGHLARKFDMGHAVEARVLRDFAAAGFEVTEGQREFEDLGGMFRGHCDGVITLEDGERAILEIKSANDSSFKRFVSGGVAAKPEYEAQIHCYMGYAGLRLGVFVVENKNDQDLFVQRVPFDPGVYESSRARAARILEAESPPPKKTDDCFWCPYKTGACPNADSSCAACAYFLPERSLPSPAPGESLGHSICALHAAKTSHGDACGGFRGA